MAQTFITPKVSTLKVDIDLNAAGNIAQEGETAAGKKTISFNGFKTDGEFSDAEAVFNKVLKGIAGANPDTFSATKTVIYRVGNEE